ncbi:MAG: alkaline phosphatase family protein, partial [Candidatus Heimdallarchaeota archaeon]
MKNKVFVVGLDGATLDILLNLANRGLLKSFSWIIREGVYGKLKSTMPPSTCPAWVSSVTGVNPGKHGILDFINSVDLIKKRLFFADSQTRKCKAIWNILSEMGKKIIVMNVPVTYPPERVHGVMVSGMLTPGLKSNFTYPRDLKDELIDLGYKIDVTDTMAEMASLYKSGEKEMLIKLRELIKCRVEAANYLIESFDWDFFFMVFVALDRLHHFYWRYLDTSHIKFIEVKSERLYPLILNCYLEIDRFISSLLRKIGKDTTIIIYSDHGFKALNKFFLTNIFLKRKKMLYLKEKAIGLSLSSESVVEWLSRRGLWRHLKDTLIPLKRRLAFGLPPSKSFYDLFDLDPTQTKAFQVGYNYVRLNREIISDDQRDKILNEVVQSLSDIKIRRFIRDIYRREEVYHGPYTGQAPEIILSPAKGCLATQLMPKSEQIYIRYGEDVEANIATLMWSGDHDIDGIIMMAGPKIRSGFEIEGANIMDITP